ncbi:MAG: ATP-binding protein [Pyrinomonadaceae bacterium]
MPADDTSRIRFSSPNEVILNSLSEGVCQISLSNKIIYSNSAARSMLGMTEEELNGVSYSEVFFSTPEERYLSDIPFCPIRFVLTSGETSHVSSEIFLGRNGREIRVEYICTPLFEGEEISGAVVSFQDIAERYEAEKALGEARDLALAAVETKAMFLANMSHEIRTPLNGIIGTIDLLSDGSLSAEQSEYVRMLKTSTELLRSIVDDILDFSRIESGGVRLDEVEFSVRDTAEDILSIFSPVAKDKSIDLRSEIDAEVTPVLVGDVTKVRQVLNNLISNAVKFTNNGEVVLKITTGDADAEGEELVFEIRDTGIGIKDEAQAMLFEPFTQADESTTRLFGGTGLGLAISRQLVKIMGGRMGFESEYSRGSNFWFKLRFARSPAAEGSAGIGFAETGGEKQPEKIKVRFPGDLKVLVVEDNPINLIVTTKMLEQLGLGPETAENGMVAVEKVQLKDFDAILMDCQMPEMDGYEAARRMIENSVKPPLIFAITAGTSASERRKCAEAGMTDHISKPFTKVDLVRVLGKYFEIERSEEFLDLDKDLTQHSFATIIEAGKLETFREIESNGKKNFTNDLLKIFVDHSEKLITEMKEALSGEDTARLRGIAHSFKGSAGNAGISELFTLLEQLEAALQSKDRNAVNDQVEKIDSEFTKVKKIILSIE